MQSLWAFEVGPAFELDEHLTDLARGGRQPGVKAWGRNHSGSTSALEAHRILIGARACDMTACQTPANSESSQQVQVPAAFGAKLPSGD